MLYLKGWNHESRHLNPNRGRNFFYLVVVKVKSSEGEGEVLWKRSETPQQQRWDITKSSHVQQIRYHGIFSILLTPY